MTNKICNLYRGKICYCFFIVSILFFISSVSIYVANASVKKGRGSKEKIELIDRNSPRVEQRKIIKRLKAIEKRVKRRNDNE